jgi:citrate lyase subunit beta / citryl-CoA lyase
VHAEVARRACLSVPGSSEKMVAKARRLAVDEVILDLGDAVRTEAKADARTAVVAAVAEPGWACGSVAVRVNAAGTRGVTTTSSRLAR